MPILVIRAIDGEDAARRIEADLASLDGVLEASVNLAAQRVRVEYERDRISISDIVRALEDLGYPAERTGGRPAERAKPGEAGEPAAREEPKAAPSWLRRNKELALSLTGGVLLAVAWIGSRWLGLPFAVAIGLYVASYLFGAWDLVGQDPADPGPGQDRHLWCTERPRDSPLPYARTPPAPRRARSPRDVAGRLRGHRVASTGRRCREGQVRQAFSCSAIQVMRASA